MNELLQQISLWFSSSNNFVAPLLENWLPLSIGVAMMGTVLMIARLFRGKKATPLEERLERITPAKVELSSPDEGIFGTATPALAAQIPESQKETGDFSKLLRQAGIYNPAARMSIYALRFVLLFGALAVTGALAVAAPADQTVRIVLIGGFAAAALSITPRLYVFFRRRRRQQEIRNGLADMMDMLSMCLGGGLPMSPSLDHVWQNLISYPELAQELRILKKQAELGSLKQALADFSERVNIPEVRQVTSLLQRGDQLGTQLSPSLLDQADHFRTTRRQLATLQANKAPVKLTLPLMFCFAPAVLILLISPAMLELQEFLNPPNGRSLMAVNDQLNTGRIVRTIEGLDQDLQLTTEE